MRLERIMNSEEWRLVNEEIVVPINEFSRGESM
jgi:hypothetical protein